MSVQAQGSSAIITGAERVFIRRGPGTEFPPFATIASGSTVEIQELQGEWARVATASGQVGYVASNFLTPLTERGAPGVAVAPTKAATPVPTRVKTPEGKSTQDLKKLSEQNAALTAEIERLHAELGQLRSAVPTPESTPAAPIEAEQLQTEIKRLTGAVEVLQHRLEDPSAGAPFSVPTDPLIDQDRTVTGAAVLMGVGGLMIGWTIGRAHGRRQERGRRSRVRL